MPRFGSAVLANTLGWNSTTITNTSDPAAIIDWDPSKHGSIAFEANTQAFNRVTVNVVGTNMTPGTHYYFLATPDNDGWCATYFQGEDLDVVYLGPLRFCPCGIPVLYELFRVGDILYVRGNGMSSTAYDSSSDGSISAHVEGDSSHVAANFGALCTASLTARQTSDDSDANGLLGGGMKGGSWVYSTSNTVGNGITIIRGDGGFVDSAHLPSDGTNTFAGQAFVSIPMTGSGLFVFSGAGGTGRVFHNTNSTYLLNGWTSYSTNHEYTGGELDPIAGFVLVCRDSAGDTAFDLLSSVGTSVIAPNIGGFTSGSPGPHFRLARNNADSQYVAIWRGGGGGNYYTYNKQDGAVSWSTVGIPDGGVLQDVTYNRQSDQFLLTFTPTSYSTDYTSCWVGSDPGAYFGGEQGATGWSSLDGPTLDVPAPHIEQVRPVGPYFVGIQNNNTSGFATGRSFVASISGRRWCPIVGGGSTITSASSAGVFPGNGSAILATANVIYTTGSMGRIMSPYHDRL